MHIGIYIVIIVVFLLIVVFFMRARESYRSCRDCESTPRNSIILNPFIYPYSGSTCLDVTQREAHARFGTYAGEHHATPDHAPVTS